MPSFSIIINTNYDKYKILTKIMNIHKKIGKVEGNKLVSYFDQDPYIFGFYVEFDIVTFQMENEKGRLIIKFVLNRERTQVLILYSGKGKLSSKKVLQSLLLDITGELSNC
jgi:hypothetical protein